MIATTDGALVEETIWRVRDWSAPIKLIVFVVSRNRKARCFRMYRYSLRNDFVIVPSPRSNNLPFDHCIYTHRQRPSVGTAYIARASSVAPHECRSDQRSRLDHPGDDFNAVQRRPIITPRQRTIATTPQTASTIPNGHAPLQEAVGRPQPAGAREAQHPPGRPALERLADQHRDDGEEPEGRKHTHGAPRPHPQRPPPTWSVDAG